MRWTPNRSADLSPELVAFLGVHHDRHVSRAGIPVVGHDFPRKREARRVVEATNVDVVVEQINSDRKRPDALVCGVGTPVNAHDGRKGHTRRGTVKHCDMSRIYLLTLLSAYAPADPSNLYSPALEPNRVAVAGDFEHCRDRG